MSSTYGVLSTTVGLTAILVLVALMVQKELQRVSGWPWARKNMQALDIAIMPLLTVFTVVVMLRFLVDVLKIR
jgi:hypothetical protein